MQVSHSGPDSHPWNTPDPHGYGSLSRKKDRNCHAISHVALPALLSGSGGASTLFFSPDRSQSRLCRVLLPYLAAGIPTGFISPHALFMSSFIAGLGLDFSFCPGSVSGMPVARRMDTAFAWYSGFICGFLLGQNFFPGQIAGCLPMYRKTVVWKPWLFRKKNQGEMKKSVKSRKAHLDHADDTSWHRKIMPVNGYSGYLVLPCISRMNHCVSQMNHRVSRMNQCVSRMNRCVSQMNHRVSRMNRCVITDESLRFADESLFQHLQDDNSKKDHLF